MSKKRKQLHLKRRRPEAPEPGIAELVAVGWNEQDAERLCVVELALQAALLVPADVRRLLADQVAAALTWQPLRLAIPTLYGGPEHSEAWRALAVVADPPYDDFMAEMAAVDRDIVRADDVVREMLHPDNVRHINDSLRAEASGDLAGAISCLKQSIRPLHDGVLADLEFMLRHEASHTPAVWGRYLCSAAVRWGLQTEFGLDQGIELAKVVLRSLGAPEEGMQEWAPPRLARDQLVHEALLFDFGLFDSWLTHQAAPRLLQRVPGVSLWTSAQPTVVELFGPVEGGALVEDLRTGEECVVGDAGLADQHPMGRLFYGRLVEIHGDERSWFAMQPTVVDTLEQADAVITAIESGAGPAARLEAFATGLHEAGAA